MEIIQTFAGIEGSSRDFYQEILIWKVASLGNGRPREVDVAVLTAEIYFGKIVNDLWYSWSGVRNDLKKKWCGERERKLTDTVRTAREASRLASILKKKKKNETPFL